MTDPKTVLQTELELGEYYLAHDPIAQRVHRAILAGANPFDVTLIALRDALDEKRRLTRDAAGHLAVCTLAAKSGECASCRKRVKK